MTADFITTTLTPTEYTTIAPTCILRPRATRSLVREIDSIQNALNMAIIHIENKAALVKISDALYDLFCLAEQGQAGDDEIQAVIDLIRNGPAAHTTAAQMASYALVDLIDDIPF